MPETPQPRPIPERIYEPNIIHNPFTWMGIWTPDGWRVHKKRWGKAERFTVRLNGDGKTTFFPGALRDPETNRVEWQDDLHLKDDPFTDAGIYPTASPGGWLLVGRTDLVLFDVHADPPARLTPGTRVRLVSP